MTAREDPVTRATHRVRDSLRALVADIREARLAAGLSQQAVANAIGISRSQLSRIEHGIKTDVSIILAGRLAGAVGLDLSIRAYAGAMRIRDQVQLLLLARAQARLGHSWRWRLEVVLPMPGDQRAWDAAATHKVSGVRIWVEAESRIHDVQALLRRIELKRRDSHADRVVLLVNDTRANRDALRDAAAAFASAFPASPRSAIGALVAGRDPGADVLLVM
jgi:transcriptional regulator with XRE-family HTH domain